MEKNGFDIVIGNPPYIGESQHKDTFAPIKQGNLRKYYQGKMDYFYFFFHLGLNLGNMKSVISFITTNYFLTANGAKKLREDLKARANFISLLTSMN